jgi:hypothetical protein
LENKPETARQTRQVTGEGPRRKERCCGWRTDGRRIRLALKAKGLVDTGTGLDVVEASVLALMGLMIAFTFSGAASRFDTRRQQIVDEANCISTAYVRLDLLAEADQPSLREKFRQYVDARMEAYRDKSDVDAVKAGLAKGTRLQGEIWKVACTSSMAAPLTQSALLVLPALNAMIDITTTRYTAIETHPPVIVFQLLTILTLLCSLRAGHGKRTRS